MLKLPTLAFYFSPFPKLPASLYPLLLPQSSLLPNHLSYLSSPPASQTKLRIPCCPLLKTAQKILANPLALLPSLHRLPFFLHHYPYSFLYQLSCTNRANPLASKITSPQKLASKNQTPTPPSKKSAESPSYLNSPTISIPLSPFSLLKSIAHAYPLTPLHCPHFSRLHKHPKNTP